MAAVLYLLVLAAALVVLICQQRLQILERVERMEQLLLELGGLLVYHKQRLRLEPLVH
jgi:hypothetical protein